MTATVIVKLLSEAQPLGYKSKSAHDALPRVSVDAASLVANDVAAHEFDHALTHLVNDCGVVSGAMMTVVPVRLMRSSSRMMPSDVAGSRFPVGVRNQNRWLVHEGARARATRCCSPPESWPGSHRLKSVSPTRSGSVGDRRSNCGLWESDDFQGERDVLCDGLLRHNRKSWNTAPIPDGKDLHERIFAMSLSLTMTLPDVAFSSRRSSRKKVDFAGTRRPNQEREFAVRDPRLTSSRAGADCAL